ncbi:hypothetical protein [Gordonia sihwensis]|uniref:hypothetical protein n=1 Tax=Gordonia sihwensis TaxID=173559 RepID=UPI000B0479B3|nr:hypothetical protein [Gordonia sihwensis]
MTEMSAAELAVAVHPTILENRVYGTGLHTVNADVVYPLVPYWGDDHGGQTVVV